MLDPRGRRSYAELRAQFHDLREPECDWRASAAEIEALIGDDRPLCASDPESEAQAEALIEALGL